MSSFVQIDPMPHASWVTRVIRLDGDFTLSLAVDKGGTVSYSYYNVQGIPDDYTYKPSPADENLEEAVISKDGTNESIVFRVKVYYNASDETLEDHQIPRAWTYGSAINKDNYLPGTLLDSISETFPVTIWNTLKAGQNAPSTNTASAVTFDTLYTRLGTVDKRREYLRQRLSEKVHNPINGPLTGFTSFPVITGETITVNEAPGDLTLPLTHWRKVQGFWAWLEMLTRAVATDSNLNSQKLFALLNGEISLSSWEVLERLQVILAQQIRVGSRDGWNFRKFGSVAQATAQDPWIYTTPAQASMWATTAESEIDIGSLSAVDQYNWMDWLRG